MAYANAKTAFEAIAALAEETATVASGAAPAAHTHVAADVTNFNTAADARIAAASIATQAAWTGGFPAFWLDSV